MQNDCSHSVDLSRYYFSMATAIDEFSEDSTLLKPKQVPSYIRIGMDCAFSSSCIADSSETLVDDIRSGKRASCPPGGHLIPLTFFCGLLSWITALLTLSIPLLASISVT